MSQTAYKKSLKVLQILEESGFQARLVGGCVRDRLLGITPKDYDVTTDAKPEDIMKVFKKQGLKVIPTGISHGTITVLMDQTQIEVTTLRIDVETDGRHAKVEFSHSFLLDAKRRDFTINAMSEDRNGTIYDYFSGQEDLKQKKIKFVGDPEERIKEDFLRILRFFRFLARFNLTSEKHTTEIIARYAQNLTSISQERVTAELKGILSCLEVKGVLKLMHETGVLQVILPELFQEARRFSFENIFDKIGFLSFLNRLALLFLVTVEFEWKKDAAKNFCRRLKLSNKEEKTFVFLVRKVHHLLELGLKNSEIFHFLDDLESSCGEEGFKDHVFPVWSSYFLYRHGKEKSSIYLDKLRTIHECFTTFGSLRKEALPLDGNDLSTCTDIRGKDFGILMQILKNGFYDQEWRTKEEGREFIQKVLEKFK